MTSLPSPSDISTRRRREIELLKGLPRPEFLPYRPPGVLLSDWIQFYVENYDLIRPYEEGQLKRAGYELSVGGVHSIAGRTTEISDEPGKNELRIERFEVAIIQTRERLNMPDFIIGRWNIRVALAYKGLLWVGAAQVDPGYQGFLFCPIYNLSDEAVTLHWGDPLALIDFVTTTPPTRWSKSYPSPENRTRLLFEDYGPDKLKSALAERAERRVNQLEGQVEAVRSRFETYALLTFAILAVLFALPSIGGGVLKTAPQLDWVSVLNMLAFFCAATSMYFALNARSTLDLIRHQGIGATTKAASWGRSIALILFAIVCIATVVLYTRSLQRRVDTLDQQLRQLQSDRAKPAPTATPDKSKQPPAQTAK